TPTSATKKMMKPTVGQASAVLTRTLRKIKCAVPKEHCELRSGQFPQEHCSPQTLHFLSPLTISNSVHLPFTFFLHFHSSMAITITHCPSPCFPLPSTCPVTFLHAYSI